MCRPDLLDWHRIRGANLKEHPLVVKKFFINHQEYHMLKNSLNDHLNALVGKELDKTAAHLFADQLGEHFANALNHIPFFVETTYRNDQVGIEYDTYTIILTSNQISSDIKLKVEVDIARQYFTTNRWRITATFVNREGKPLDYTGTWHKEYSVSRNRILEDDFKEDIDVGVKLIEVFENRANINAMGDIYYDIAEVVKDKFAQLLKWADNHGVQLIQDTSADNGSLVIRVAPKSIHVMPAEQVDNPIELSKLVQVNTDDIVQFSSLEDDCLVLSTD